MTRDLLERCRMALEYHQAQTRTIHNTGLVIDAIRAELAKPERPINCGSNLRTEIAGRGVPDGWRMVPVDATLAQKAAMGPAIRACYGLDGVAGDVTGVYCAMITAAPQPPQIVALSHDEIEQEITKTCRTCNAALGEMHVAAGNLRCGWPARVSTSDCEPLDDEKPPAQPERPINCGTGHCSCIECVVAQETCKWTQNDEWWSAACGASWAFIDCGPVENGVKFCHGCGKPVEIVESK